MVALSRAVKNTVNLIRPAILWVSKSWLKCPKRETGLFHATQHVLPQMLTFIQWDKGHFQENPLN